jgi:hypothetical protein
MSCAMLMVGIVALSGCAHIGPRRETLNEEWRTIYHELAQRGASVSDIHARGTMVLERAGGIRNRLLCRLRYQEPDRLTLDASHRMGGRVFGVASEDGSWVMEYQTPAGAETWKGSDRDPFLGMPANALARCLVFGVPPEGALKARVRRSKEGDSYQARFRTEGYRYEVTVVGPDWHMHELTIQKGSLGSRVAAFVFDPSGESLLVDIPPANIKADIQWESVQHNQESTADESES